MTASASARLGEGDVGARRRCSMAALCRELVWGDLLPFSPSPPTARPPSLFPFPSASGLPDLRAGESVGPQLISCHMIRPLLAISFPQDLVFFPSWDCSFLLVRGSVGGSSRRPRFRAPATLHPRPLPSKMPPRPSHPWWNFHLSSAFWFLPTPTLARLAWFLTSAWAILLHGVCTSMDLEILDSVGCCKKLIVSFYQERWRNS
jgi:hypothetical protein